MILVEGLENCENNVSIAIIGSAANAKHRFKSIKIFEFTKNSSTRVSRRYHLYKSRFKADKKVKMMTYTMMLMDYD